MLVVGSCVLVVFVGAVASSAFAMEIAADACSLGEADEVSEFLVSCHIAAAACR